MSDIDQRSTVEELRADLDTLRHDLPVQYVDPNGTVYNSTSVHVSDKYGEPCVVVEIASDRNSGLDVFVLVIDHEYGTNTEVYATTDGAKKAVAAWVDKYWHEIADRPAVPDTRPDNDDEAIRIYFENAATEGWMIQPAKVMA